MGITTLLKKSRAFLFPPYCLYCEALLTREPFFCADCTLFFELISPVERCYSCFEPSERKVCRFCRTKRRKFVRAYCVESTGQATTLIQKQRQGNKKLIQVTAALLYVQFHRLGFPSPDYLVPLYEVPFARLFKKCDHNYLLIKELQKQFQVTLYRGGRAKNLLVVKDRASNEEIETVVQQLEASEAKIFILTLLP